MHAGTYLRVARQELGQESNCRKYLEKAFKENNTPANKTGTERRTIATEVRQGDRQVRYEQVESGSCV